MEGVKKFKHYLFKQDGHKFIIVNTETGEEKRMSTLQAMNFYNKLVNNGDTINKAEFLQKLLYQLTHNMRIYAGDDFAKEWSSNVDIGKVNDLKPVIVGYYFNTEYDQGHFIQVELTPVQEKTGSYGIIIRIFYDEEIKRELKVVTGVVTNFDKNSDDIPVRAIMNMPDIESVAPNIICSEIQTFMFKLVDLVAREV